MNLFIKSLLPTLAFFFFSTPLSALSSKQMVFKIAAEGDSWTLKVYLSPEAAFEILDKEDLGPIKIKASNLDAYVLYLEDYFQKTFAVSFDREAVSFALTSWNLQSEDASMTFALDRRNQGWNSIRVQASSMLDIYASQRNIVYIQTDRGTFAERLNSQKNAVSFENLSSDSKNFLADGKFVWLITCCLLVSMTLVLLFWQASRRNKMQYIN